MAIKVETDVPMPSHGNAKPSGLSETLRTMQVGHSFIYDTGRVCNVYNTARRLGVRVVLRKEGDAHRVWKKA